MARAGESTRGEGPPLVRGGTGDLPQKIYISRVSEKQSEALLRLFSQTILKENNTPFLYFHMTYFTPVHSRTEYNLSKFSRSYVGRNILHMCYYSKDSVQTLSVVGETGVSWIRC